MKIKYVAAAVFFLLVAGAIFLLRRPPAPATPPPPSAAAPTVPTPTPADCLLPGPAPVVPDGTAASAQEMHLAHEAIQSFVNQLEAYQSCRNTEADRAPPGTSGDKKDRWIAQGNAAVDQANQLATAFGEQLKNFKEKHPGVSTTE